MRQERALRLKRLAPGRKSSAGAAGLRPAALRARLNRRCPLRKDLALDEAVGDRAHAGGKDVNNGSRVLQYFAITAAWAARRSSL